LGAGLLRMLRRWDMWCCLLGLCRRCIAFGISWVPPSSPRPECYWYADGRLSVTTLSFAKSTPPMRASSPNAMAARPSAGVLSGPSSRWGSWLAVSSPVSRPSSSQLLSRGRIRRTLSRPSFRRFCLHERSRVSWVKGWIVSSLA